MITILGELYSSKNSRRILRCGYRRFIGKSELAKKQEQSFAWQLKDIKLKNEWNKMIAGREYPLRLKFTIYRRTHRRFDFINIIQGLLDAMVKAGYLPDDDSKHVWPEFGAFQIDKKSPRTKIEIYNPND